MNYVLQLMDYIFLQVLWVCHEIYNTITSIRGQAEGGPDENSTIFRGPENNKRHFIHLYTTESVKSGRPTCYMDVYEIFSSKDEQRLRSACSRGIPNKTYLKYNQNTTTDDEQSQSWLEYSTLAL